MVNVIVAIAKNYIIGANNQLLWHISEDMRYFRKVTTAHPVIMGRKTYESIGRPLPKRRNIVVSRQNITIEGCEVCNSLKSAVAQFDGADQDIFIIGGAQIYEQSLAFADRIYITRIDRDYEGDTLFPRWNEEAWKMISEEKFARGENFDAPFSFEVWERKLK